MATRNFDEAAQLESSIAQSNSLFLYKLLDKEDKPKNIMIRDNSSIINALNSSAKTFASIMILKRALQLACHQGDTESVRILGDICYWF